MGIAAAISIAYWKVRGWFAPGGATVGISNQRNDGLAVIGWITAILVPMIGLVVAVILGSRNDRRGVPIAITAVVVMVVWIGFWVILNIIAANSLHSAGY
jgi:hypothetical protein